MANWIDKYKQLIYSSQHSKVIVCDPDGLFVYPELSNALEEVGYAIYRAHTALELRILYELHFRKKDTRLILVAPGNYTPLPDIGVEVHFVEVGLRQLFPNLNDQVLKGLSFNALCLLGNIKSYEEMGKERTLRFLLENLYNLDLNALNGSRRKERLLDALITVLFNRDGVNVQILTYLTDLVRSSFPELANASLTRENLLEYLQGIWRDYVLEQKEPVDLQEPSLLKSMIFLFIRGELISVLVSAERYHSIPPALRIGVRFDAQEAQRDEINALLGYLEQQRMNIQDIPEEWFDLAPIAGKAMLKALELGDDLMLKALDETIDRINVRFQLFIDNAYSGLFSRSGVRWPVMVTRILDYIKAQSGSRKALIVVDGMNYWQWEILAGMCRAAGVPLKEGTTLAYIPSITAWSRQAIFRGGKPDLTTGNAQEASLFKAYWQQHQVADYQVFFERFGANLSFSPDKISSAVSHLALVCNDLDDMMHGAVLGNEQLYTSTLQWIARSNIISMLQSLKARGFTCYLATDHGNLQAMGIRNFKLTEKVGSLSRSKRHLKFSNTTLLQSFLEQNPSLRYGIIDNSVYLRDTTAFTDAQTKVVTHGGSHFWEVLIPFAEI